MDSPQKVIRSLEIPREPPHRIGIRSNRRFKIYRAHKLFGLSFLQNALRQPSCSLLIHPKSYSDHQKYPGNYLIKMNGIHSTVTEISCPQAFWAAILENGRL